MDIPRTVHGTAHRATKNEREEIPARFAVYVPQPSRRIMFRRAAAALSLLPWRCCRSSIRNRAASAPSGASSMIRAASSGVVYRAPSGGMLYFNGVDSVSISKRLGHAQVSTTANIYAHVMEEADQRNADILADVFLKKA